MQEHKKRLGTDLTIEDAGWTPAQGQPHSTNQTPTMYYLETEKGSVKLELAAESEIPWEPLTKVQLVLTFEDGTVVNATLPYLLGITYKEEDEED